MEKFTNTENLVEAGLNKYGQRLDEFNEFGQSLEAEIWHFDGLVAVSVAALPALECLIRPAREKMLFPAEQRNSGKTREAGLNKYGQRLDEYNEFGQSLEAEAWHFDGLVTVSVAPLPALESLIRPTHVKKLAATANSRPLAAAHRRAA